MLIFVVTNKYSIKINRFLHHLHYNYLNNLSISTHENRPQEVDINDFHKGEIKNLLENYNEDDEDEENDSPFFSRCLK